MRLLSTARFIQPRAVKMRLISSQTYVSRLNCISTEPENFWRRGWASFCTLRCTRWTKSWSMFALFWAAFPPLCVPMRGLTCYRCVGLLFMKGWPEMHKCTNAQMYDEWHRHVVSRSTARHALRWCVISYAHNVHAVTLTRSCLGIQIYRYTDIKWLYPSSPDYLLECSGRFLFLRLLAFHNMLAAMFTLLPLSLQRVSFRHRDTNQLLKCKAWAVLACWHQFKLLTMPLADNIRLNELSSTDSSRSGRWFHVLLGVCVCWLLPCALVFVYCRMHYACFPAAAVCAGSLLWMWAYECTNACFCGPLPCVSYFWAKMQSRLVHLQGSNLSEQTTDWQCLAFPSAAGALARQHHVRANHWLTMSSISVCSVRSVGLAETQSSWCTCKAAPRQCKPLIGNVWHFCLQRALRGFGRDAEQLVHLQGSTTSKHFVQRRSALYQDFAR